MRRGAAVLLCVVMMMFTGCVSSSKSAEKSAEDIRNLIIESEISLTADVTADYGDRVYDFTLNYDTGTDIIEVTKPELLSGVTVKVSEDDGATILTFDGAEINTGDFDENGLSPMTVLPILVKQWREGYILESYFETVNDIDAVVIKTDITDDILCVSWFERSTGEPIKAEVSSGDQVVMRCSFT